MLFFRIISFLGVPFYYLIFLLFAAIYHSVQLIKVVYKTTFGKIIFAFSLTFIVFIISTVFFWFSIVAPLPDPKSLGQRNLDLSTKIYDRNGILLYQLYKDKNRTLVKLSDVPIHVRLATIAAEDAEFYNHPGVSIRGITRAIYKYISEGKITGGSTLTQQLVKNALLTPDRTIGRKIKEILVALAVEQKYTKDQILEMYLNEVNYGGTAYGIAEAARQYFGKEVSQLSIAEGALLAGLPKSPSVLSPSAHESGKSIDRQKNVLELMRANNFVNEKEFDTAISEKLSFTTNAINIKAPHFVMYIKNILEKTYGNDIYQRGFSVYTTLDLSLQEYSENAIKDELSKLSRVNVGNGAALVLRPDTGEILSMVGSKDYFNELKSGNVNVVFSPRQPGSSIKVVNYAYALTQNFSAATILDDSPITFKILGQEPYTPKDYDGKYRGRISLRSALAESRNIPAVRVLNEIGIKNMLEMGRKMGINSWTDPYKYGLSLTLGGGEITLYELANVYATLASYGQRPEIFGIEKVLDSSGKTIYYHQVKKTPVLDPRVAYILTDILRDNKARSPAFGTHSALVIPDHNEVAVKTGTSNNLRDNLTVGYTKDYVVAVWVGNNNNSPMSRVASGVTGASPIWNKIMSKLVAGKNAVNWEIPGGLIKADTCGGKEWFLKEKARTFPCPIQADSQSGRQAKPAGV